MKCFVHSRVWRHLRWVRGFVAAGGLVGCVWGRGLGAGGRALPSGVCPAGGLRRRFACGFGFGFGLFVAVLLVSWD